ncbi:hypothetical protein PMAYCL1PPCAC_10758 [Pristionchus mayeri]|uniref:G protein-coupled receptor n=1 Tax=Pristionchus mayeri TaxID=1317129 RepID=A0AAN5C7P7_9BILA|nr:hypothetical protein PMAYCL1PPCAC_10758 [Pristionchus mayeri]
MNINFTINPTYESAMYAYSHFISAISLVVAVSTLYLIYFKTNRNSQRYKILLMNVVMCTTLMDIHLGVLFIPLPLIPFPGGYCIGWQIAFPSRFGRFQDCSATLTCRCTLEW